MSSIFLCSLVMLSVAATATECEGDGCHFKTNALLQHQLHQLAYAHSSNEGAVDDYTDSHQQEQAQPPDCSYDSKGYFSYGYPHNGWAGENVWITNPSLDGSFAGCAANKGGIVVKDGPHMSYDSCVSACDENEDCNMIICKHPDEGACWCKLLGSATCAALSDEDKACCKRSDGSCLFKKPRQAVMTDCAPREITTEAGHAGQVWITHECGLSAGLNENHGRDGLAATVNGDCAQRNGIGVIVSTGTCECWRDLSKVGYHCVMTPDPANPNWDSLDLKLVLNYQAS